MIQVNTVDNLQKFGIETQGNTDEETQPLSHTVFWDFVMSPSAT
jgi:hypothetical protein